MKTEDPQNRNFFDMRPNPGLTLDDLNAKNKGIKIKNNV